MPFTTSFAAREDSGSANNPALNLTGDPAITITFVAETPDGGTGDYIIDGGNVEDPDTQVEIGGTLYSFTFALRGAMPTLKNDGAQQVPDQFEGETVYIIIVSDYPTTGDTTRFAFMPDAGATLADMDAFGNGAIDVEATSTSAPPVAVCFAEGTSLATPFGPVSVENLRTGNALLTADDGYQPIRWIGQKEMSWSDAPHKEKPFLFSAGCLGHDMPSQPLIVSRQHRMLLKDPVTGHETLVPAHLLERFPGVRQMHGKRAVRYFHILMPRHAIVFANGVGAESFWPGPMATAALNFGERLRMLSALAEMGKTTQSYESPARPFASRRDASKITNMRGIKPSLLVEPLSIAV